jgi:hypothetical protein
MNYGGMIVHDSYVSSVIILDDFGCLRMSCATAHERHCIHCPLLVARLQRVVRP